MRFQVSRQAIVYSEQVDKANLKGDNYFFICGVWSADTSIREVCEETKIGSECVEPDATILSLLQKGSAKLWDCTIYPPKEITEWPLTLFPETRGSKSKTLYDAGWFPSCNLQVLPPERQPVTATAADFEDPQYNRLVVEPGGTMLSSSVVQLKSFQSGEKPLPSQILASVAERFSEGDEANDAETATAKDQRTRNREALRVREMERNRRLDDRIRRLEELSVDKHKRVSEQVQKMLIKSRATGPDNLKIPDRFYLRCIVDDGLSIKEELRFFSTQFTVGRILSSFSVPKERQAELLVLHRESKTCAPCYRRLPVLMRLYEAVAGKYLDEFAKVIVRIYNSNEDERSSCIDVESLEDFQSNDDEQALPGEIQKEAFTSGVDTSIPQRETLLSDVCLRDAIREKNAANKNDRSNENVSSTALKVRQMQMKSKASGDSKRIKMEDRFFIDLITAIGNHEKGYMVTMKPVFLSFSDKIDRLVRDCSSPPSKDFSYEFLLFVSEENATFRRFEDCSLSFREAESKNLLKRFDTLILRFFPNFN